MTLLSNACLSFHERSMEVSLCTRVVLEDIVRTDHAPDFMQVNARAGMLQKTRNRC